MSKSEGFQIKSTHKFINPSAVTETEIDDEFMYQLSNSSGAQTKVVNSSKPSGTNTDTKVKTGSATGMAIRTTIKAMEDFY